MSTISAPLAGGTMLDAVSSAMGADEFDALVQPVLPVLLRFAARLTSWGQAEDVVQEALVKAWEKRRRFDDSKGTLQAWLLGITANEARMERRRARRRGLLIEVPDGPAVCSEPEAAHDFQLEACLLELSPRQRLVIDCFYYADLPVADIAVVMKCSIGTVKSTLFDARARLRLLLEATGR